MGGQVFNIRIAAATEGRYECVQIALEGVHLKTPGSWNGIHDREQSEDVIIVADQVTVVLQILKENRQHTVGVEELPNRR